MYCVYKKFTYMSAKQDLNIFETVNNSINFELGIDDVSSYLTFIGSNRDEHNYISKNTLNDKIRYAKAFLKEYPKGLSTPNIKDKIIA